MKKVEAKHINERTTLKRIHRVGFMLNDEEYRVVKRYMNKYKVSNGSKVMREAVIRTFLKQLDEDRPTLFD